MIIRWQAILIRISELDEKKKRQSQNMRSHNYIIIICTYIYLIFISFFICTSFFSFIVFLSDFTRLFLYLSISSLPIYYYLFLTFFSLNAYKSKSCNSCILISITRRPLFWLIFWLHLFLVNWLGANYWVCCLNAVHRT